MELSSSNIRKFLVFREMELFCVLGNGNLEKIPYIFSKESFSYISGNRNPPKIIYISGNGNPKKILIFQEAEIFLQLKIQKFSYSFPYKEANFSEL